MPQDAGGVLAEPVLCSARPVVSADRLPRRPTGCARRLAAILWCAAGVSPSETHLPAGGALFYYPSNKFVIEEDGNGSGRQENCAAHDPLRDLCADRG